MIFHLYQLAVIMTTNGQLWLQFIMVTILLFYIHAHSHLIYSFCWSYTHTHTHIRTYASARAHSFCGAKKFHYASPVNEQIIVLKRRTNGVELRIRSLLLYYFAFPKMGFVTTTSGRDLQFRPPPPLHPTFFSDDACVTASPWQRIRPASLRDFGAKSCHACRFYETKVAE